MEKKVVQIDQKAMQTEENIGVCVFLHLLVFWCFAYRLLQS
jgi:hypothetical protein